MPIRPEAAHHRARIAALSRCIANGERAPDDPELLDAYRGLKAAKIDGHIAQLVAEAPLLTDEQRTALAELLRPVRVTRRGA